MLEAAISDPAVNVHGNEVFDRETIFNLSPLIFCLR